ncbi:MAG: DUF4445 domain-containing protein, partial [Mogibacterium sp.]|nr:DUF4445 domain-containing protein [Mogibacterium sp.]
MPLITITPQNRTVPAQAGASLMDVLLAHEIHIENACGGKGLCGKCRVRITNGDPGPVTESERRLLTPAELREGIRLACLVSVQEDLTVELFHREQKHEVLTTGYQPEFEFAPEVRKVPVVLRKLTLEDLESFEDQILRQTGAGSMTYEALTGVPLNPGSFTAVVYGDQVIRMEQGDTAGALYGAAVDIGTTTVVCSVIDLNTGGVIGTASEINAQKQFGLDVLTRITYEIEHPEVGREKLRDAIVSSINGMLRSVCEDHGIPQDQIYEIAVAANCTMLHMLLGADASTIGRAPFTPAFTGAQRIPAAETGLRGAPGAMLYLLPSVSAYIGADIVAGAAVCDLQHQKSNVMFIDIGTNGEIVLASGGRLLCCSCAAGPALEGMNISCGMRAAEGAIEDVRITKNGVELEVIGGTAPAGICGSGILAAVRELLREEIVRSGGAYVKAGRFDSKDYRSTMIVVDESGKRSFVLTRKPVPLTITQGDIRQVQLAKGAILSGFTALLQRAGIGMEDLDRVLIAGQFGAHLPAESLTGTGILPAEVGDRIEYVGNTSQTGAFMALMSGDIREKMEKLAR